MLNEMHMYVDTFFSLDIWQYTQTPLENGMAPLTLQTLQNNFTSVHTSYITTANAST